MKWSKKFVWCPASISIVYYILSYSYISCDEYCSITIPKSQGHLSFPPKNVVVVVRNSDCNLTLFGCAGHRLRLRWSQVLQHWLSSLWRNLRGTERKWRISSIMATFHLMMSLRLPKSWPPGQWQRACQELWRKFLAPVFLLDAQLMVKTQKTCRRKLMKVRLRSQSREKHSVVTFFTEVQLCFPACESW